MSEVKLPDTIHGLLRVAIDDLKKCQASKNYKIEMSEWHEPYGDDCFVCMAGAVMAQTLMADITESYSPKSFGEHARHLVEINYLRAGSSVYLSSEKNNDRYREIYESVQDKYELDLPIFHDRHSKDWFSAW